jgi:hypothetical protein
MMRSLSRRILALGALALAAACSHDPTGSSLRNIEAHEALWKAQHLSSYDFSYRIGCFCPEIVTKPAIVHVRNGQVVQVVSSTGEPVTAQMLAWWPTIDQMFERLKQERQDGHSRVSITWNERLGYPALVSSDWPNALDAGYEQQVNEVHPAAQ